MDELLDILEEIKPDVDIKTCVTLIDDGILDSFDIISAINEINSTFDIQIPPAEIVPENFNSAAALWDMIQRLMDS